MAKINVFELSGPEGGKKKFQKTLFLAFEVIVQPHYFLHIFPFLAQLCDVKIAKNEL